MNIKSKTCRTVDYYEFIVEGENFMKKMMFGCTLLIIGSLFSEYSFMVAIPFWVIGLIFVLISFLEDNKDK